jgi:disulfide bond formation protein DsbB
MSLLITLVAAGTVLLDAVVVIGVFALVKRAWREKMFALMRDYALVSFIVLSVLSVAGTLLLQYADNLAPCVLCWWQRVFMYPIAFISLIAFAKNTSRSDIADYVLALSIPGALVALYQHLLQVLPTGALIPCDPTNDCAVRSVFEFGFVTLPWMGFTVFIALICIALVARQSETEL